MTRADEAMSELIIMTCEAGQQALSGKWRFRKDGLWYWASLVAGSDMRQLLVADERRRLFEQGISLAWRRADFKPQALFLDFDATLVEEETIDVLAEAVGCQAEVARLTAEAMEGTIVFKEALFARLAMLEGLPAAKLEEVAGKLRVHKGADAFIRRCQVAGIPAFIASGGFNQIVGIVAKKLGIEEFLANELDIQAGRLSGRVLGAVVDGRAKASFVEEICKRYGFDAQYAVAVGDGSNDRLMLQQVGLRVGHDPKQVLYESLHVANFTGSYRFLEDFLFGSPS